jgi:acyl carrier protein
MSVRAAVISHIEQIGREMNKDLPPLTDDLILMDSGLDSLAIAIAITRLEEELGLDPFTQSSDISYPVTLGDFIHFYENAAQATDVATGEAG